MNMVGYKIVKFLLLMMAVDLLLFTLTAGKTWWVRRRSGSSRSSRRPVCSSAQPPGIAWKNNWHASFSFTCPTNQSIRLWQSEHRNCKEDRIHYFKCGYGPGRYSEGNCKWTSHYVNDYEDPVVFKCERNGFITGVKSHFNNGAKDRRFEFRCCHKPRYSTRNCKHTSYVNHWDAAIKYTVPHDYYLTGAYSYHRNYFEDRRWKFEICQFKKCR